MRDDRYLQSRVLQIVGIAAFVASLVFWAVTDRESTLFVSASVGLILLGRYPKLGRGTEEDR